MRIRSRLLLLVLAVLVPALLGTVTAVGYVYREERASRYESMQETARAMALALDRDMERREAILSTLANSTSLDRGELERFYGYAVEVARQVGATIILSDPDGRTIFNTRLPFGTELPPMLSAGLEERARAGNEATVISDVYIPPNDLGPHSFAVQVPVRRGDDVTMFLTLATFASEMQRLLTEQGLPEGWLGTILDRRGVILARSVEPDRFVGEPISDRFAATIAAQAEGIYDGTSLGGVPITVFFSRAPRAGWVFLLGVPRTALFAPTIRTTVLMATISLLLLGLGVGAATLVARRISKPIERLRVSAERLGHNEPVQATPYGSLELDEVGHAMADASERLRNARGELERRVAEAVASFEKSQQALVQAQKLEALGRLTGGIAHDFNNVLQTLTTGLQAIEQIAPGPPDLIERCQRAVARGTGLARQLMAFGRVQEARVETIDIAARVADTRPLLRGALPEDIDLEVEVGPNVWPVTVDPAQLELALLNLVINSRDAMPDGGTIVLRVHNAVEPAEAELEAGDYVVLTVIDDGAGMTPEVMARAFDPFYTTKAVGEGSGMGLPQAYGFARQHGGTLTLESSPGSGTTVRMYLPRSLESLTFPPAPTPDLELPPCHGKVLLVEDDDDVRDMVSAALSASGFDVRTAVTADEALQQFASGEHYDAVLTDVVMPGEMSGVDLADHLRKHQPAVGVVVATGYSERAVHLAGVKALAKPYDLRQAVEALNAAMADSGQPDEPEPPARYRRHV